jgi:hypothetical protein
LVRMSGNVSVSSAIAFLPERDYTTVEKNGTAAAEIVYTR